MLVSFLFWARILQTGRSIQCSKDFMRWRGRDSGSLRRGGCGFGKARGSRADAGATAVKCKNCAGFGPKPAPLFFCTLSVRLRTAAAAAMGAVAATAIPSKSAAAVRRASPHMPVVTGAAGRKKGPWTFHGPKIKARLSDAPTATRPGRRMTKGAVDVPMALRSKPHKLLRQPQPGRAEKRAADVPWP